MIKVIKPADGIKVRRPDGQHLSESGEAVEMSTYWTRRLLSNDVIEVVPESADKKTGSK